MGTCLALPWLETFSKPLHAQAATQATRYIFIYFPNGVAHDFWSPTGTGAGDAWTLSALQEPLAPYKQYCSVLTNVGQTELFGGNPNPSHSQLAGPTWTGARNDPAAADCGGPSIDQVLAANIGTATPFDSLQLGLSTMNSYPDGQHPAISRSMSWSNATTPLYKEVNPQAVFDSLIEQIGPGGGTAGPDPTAVAAAELRKARDLSALDFVMADAESLKLKLSSSDNTRLDQFLDSVRDLEGRVQLQMPGMGGTGGNFTRPTLSASYQERADIKNVDPNDPQGYTREAHAEVMNDLITMAFQTDMTRVISLMQDDARSDYHYNFLKQRTFAGNSSTETATQLESPLNGDLLGFHALQHDGDSNDGFATVNHWLVSKFASLIDRFAMTPDPTVPGKMLIDTTYMQFQSGMQGSNHQADMLPIVIAGAGGGVYKMNQHHSFPSEVRLADVHLTLLQAGFGLSNVTSFGNSGGIVDALLV
jgi:hypothetical protein